MQNPPLELSVDQKRKFGQAQVTILGDGLVGHAIAETLSGNNYDVTSVDSDEVDLLDPLKTKAFISGINPESILIFAAGLSGGIPFNLSNPYEMYSKNIRMIDNVIDSAVSQKIKKAINLVPACVYPAGLNNRAKVEDLWQGPMEKSSLAYSTAKISGLVGFESVRKQFGLYWTNLIVTNVYGPHKKIDPKQMHVIPALIEKFSVAKSNGDKQVQILGDGTPVREFLYSVDLGEAVKSFLEGELWEVSTLNIAGSEAISILDLAKIIAEEVGYKGEIAVEKGNNNGTSIKLLEDTLFRSSGWAPRINLSQGIKIISF
jgi:GDP-L-fucose synthase